jgi:hypothetical protein
VRADDHPSQQIAEHDRLVQSLEHDCRNRRDAQDYREILKECVRIHQAEFTREPALFSLWIIAGQSGEGILFGSYSLSRRRGHPSPTKRDGTRRTLADRKIKKATH